MCKITKNGQLNLHGQCLKHCGYRENGVPLLLRRPFLGNSTEYWWASKSMFFHPKLPLLLGGDQTGRLFLRWHKLL